MLIILQCKYNISRQEENSILLNLEKQLNDGHFLVIPELLEVKEIIKDVDDIDLKIKSNKDTNTVGNFLLWMTKDTKCRITLNVRKRLDENNYRNLLQIEVSNFSKESYPPIYNSSDYLFMVRSYEKHITGQELATLELLWDLPIKYQDKQYIKWMDGLDYFEYNIVV